jgi:activator of HSP90 ATPase
MSQKLVELQLKIKDRDVQKDVDIYKAITDRLDVLLKTKPSQKDILQWQHDLAMQEHASNMNLATKTIESHLKDDMDA